VVIPTHALEPLWKNYETFEHSAAGNKNLAERVLGEQVGCWGGGCLGCCRGWLSVGWCRMMRWHWSHVESIMGLLLLVACSTP
jgi:hypothetical protein